MNDVIKRKLELLPDQSGVYIMKNAKGKIIYIGKAKVLKNRVRQYFQKGARQNFKVAAMVDNIDDFELIITSSELEALVLECNLIKEHQPKYNVLLKDGKKFPFIKLTNDTFPRLLISRNPESGGGRYFGPYPSSYLAGQTVEMVKKLFGLVACDGVVGDGKKKDRACLYHSIKYCHAPCVGGISVDDYAALAKQACAFLEGDHDKLITQLEADMLRASDAMEFEKAAALRDKLNGIRQICEKQVVHSAKGRDMDLFGAAQQDGLWVFEIFYIRGGKILGRDTYKIEGFFELSEGQALDSFLSQYYGRALHIPPAVLLPYYTDGSRALAEYLSEKRGGKTVVSAPQRGELKKCVDLAVANSKKALQEYLIETLSAVENSKVLSQLAKDLNLSRHPLVIEAYDISNTSGADNVAGMVVFENGLPKKSLYKRFKIKYTTGANDCQSIYECILRRMERYKNRSEGFDYLPDLILVDGGKGQVTAALSALEVCGIEVPVFGMKKDDKHRTDCLVGTLGDIVFKKTGPQFRLLTRIQDEVHRFALDYHKKSRKKSALESELDNIKGVGQARRQALRKRFKSLKQIKEATKEQLAETPGVDRRTAENIFNYFSNQRSSDGSQHDAGH